MSTGAVISIHSVHAKNIYSGVKRFEFRTQKPSRDIDYLVLYETGKSGLVTGLAKVTDIIEGTPAEIWKLTKTFAGITPVFFDEYYSGKEKAVAYCLGETREFDQAIPLCDIGVQRAPQSFQYLENAAVDKLLEWSSTSIA